MEENVKEVKKFKTRPWTGGPRPVRQIGRWDDDSWAEIRAAAKSEGKSVADWVRRILQSEAARIRMAGKNKSYTDFFDKIR